MKKIVLVASLVFTAFLSQAQNQKILWQPINEKEIKVTGNRDIIPEKYKTFSLDFNGIKSALAQSPQEKDIPSSLSNIEISLPMPDGSLQRFRVTESPVMAEPLQMSFPEIRTYNVKGIDDKYASGKLDITEFGFHGMIRSPYGDIFIDPYCKWNTKDYISYYTSDFSKPLEYRLPEVGVLDAEANTTSKVASPNAVICAGPNLKTYRLAIGCTGQYATAATGTSSPTTSQVLAKVVTTVNRVDGVYETEVGVRLVLVPTTTLTLYLKTATTTVIAPAPTATAQPYTGNSSAGTLINESQTIINNQIGSANYDIGHTFSTGGGGLAQLGCVCGSSKARGITGSPSPVGDPYDIDYVAHEVGHQFSGNHTFNNNTLGSCAGNRNSTAAMEPGSGVTIMGYAGICSTDNIANNSIAYFHAVSYDEIMNFVTNAGGNSCDVMTASGNSAPVVSISTTNYTVPANTPFYLTGSATDPNGDAVTYQWEEIDLGTAGTWNSGSKPYFRSYTPTVTPTRYFPNLTALRTGSLQGTKGEYLPTTSQILKFRLTARDNKMGGGGVCSATTAVNTTTVAGPFSVTSQSVTGITYPSGSSQTVSWNVNNTNIAPINCSSVNILVSIDNGNNWTLVSSNTANDGSEVVTLPTTATSMPLCRVKVESVGNIFFAMNIKAFAITAVTGVQQYLSNSDINLYPNPFSNTVKIDISGNSNLNADKTFINVYDILGNLVRTENVRISENFSKVYDLSELANGTYIIIVSDGKQKATAKLIKL